jgi:hypothetical protein
MKKNKERRCFTITFGTQERINQQQMEICVRASDSGATAL